MGLVDFFLSTTGYLVHFEVVFLKFVCRTCLFVQQAPSVNFILCNGSNRIHTRKRRHGHFLTDWLLGGESGAKLGLRQIVHHGTATCFKVAKML